MHFHDEDETWIIVGGKGKATMIDRDGQKSEFLLEAGDVWMVEAGVQHGAEPITDELLISHFMGTIPEGSHRPGHYTMEKEQYMPTLHVVKTPLNERPGEK